MADEPDFITRVESISKNWTGEEFTPERAIEQFQLYSPEFRATVLDDYDRELAVADTSNLRRYSELNSLHSSLSNLHHALRKAGR